MPLQSANQSAQFSNFYRGGLQMSTAEPAGPIGHARGPIWQKDTTKDVAVFNMAKCCVTWGKALYLDSNIKEGKAFNLPVEA